ncbi:hypothetical protein GIB67_025836 [Kingdonia uniflora]|uniref:Uncharacterized protein n=1 Tax=Kingdonia uniflora TaxID=39325 RepID=A0A7J7N4X1_9MAGN|nr:hypothetical protein GIB67_025836 [Kingdonia uniflora]
MEAKFYAVKIESLQADNQRMDADVSDYWNVLVDLESAKSKIKTLKKKMRLKEENMGLANEIEQLQANRCVNIEELVYLRWVNACLQHKHKHYQAPPGKTLARELSKNSSPRSEKKVKKLIPDHTKSEGTNDKQDGFNLMAWT